MLASGSQDKTIRLWNITDGSSREVGRHADEVWSVAFSPDGRTLASGSKDKTIRLWNAADGLLLRELRGGKDYWFNSVAFSPDSTMLASGPWDKTIRIWNVADSSSGELKGHADIVFSVAFSPNGRMLASGSHDKTIRLWGLFASLREALVALRGGCRDI